MGILDRLFGGRFTLPPPEETTVSDAAIMRELHPYRSELKAFAQAILARMPENERTRLVRRVQQTHHGAGTGNTLLDPLGIEKITGLGPQARAWSQGSKIVENGDDFVLAPQHFSHQRTAEAAHGTIEHHFDDRGFGVFHGCFPL